MEQKPTPIASNGRGRGWVYRDDMVGMQKRGWAFSPIDAGYKKDVQRATLRREALRLGFKSVRVIKAVNEAGVVGYLVEPVEVQEQ